MTPPRARPVSSPPYENDYCFVFELEDGRIRRAREYIDTLRGWRQVFGPAAAALAA